MITNDCIKKEFIHQIIDRGLKKIYSEQAYIVSHNLNTVSGDLLRHLGKMPFTLGGKSYYIRVLPYLRYLDIHYRQDKNLRRNLALYNRTVWGVLYGETLPNLRYGLTKDMRKYISAQLTSGQDVNSDDFDLLLNY